MLKERIDDLVDILAEEYSKIENTFLIRNNQQLVKYAENPTKWKAEQMAHRLAFKKEIAREIGNNLKTLNEKAEKVLLLSYKEVDENIIEISEKEIKVNKYQKEIQEKMKEIKEFNEKSLKQLANISYDTYTRTVKVLGAKSNTDDLFEAIKRQMPKGIQNGLKVAYKDKRQMSWKSYMEMNARTTIQQETSKRQLEVGALAGQVFYVCDSFGDCAKDHADFQGKIYYNEEAKLTEQVQKYIDQNNIKSMQEVMNGEPFLTTRPNCRHNFHAISTDDVLKGMSGEEIAEQEGFKFGDYKDTNYMKLQQQRYNERQIRKWKTEYENQKQLAKTTGIPNKLAETKALGKVREWQNKQRQLIKENPNVLERNYARENAKIIVEDLGVKYKYKVVDGELKKK